MHFLHFLFDLCIGRLLKSDHFMITFFQRESIALQYTFSSFWPKVHFLPHFRDKVSGNERSLPRFHLARFDQKVLYLAFAHCVLKVLFLHFLKRGDAKVVYVRMC